MTHQYKLPVAGVTYENRQSVLKQYIDSGWVPGHLEREPSNTYDKHAVRVYLKGECIGYIPKESSNKWSEYLHSIGPERMIVRGRVIGGVNGKNLGCQLYIQTPEPVGEPLARRAESTTPAISRGRRESDFVLRIYAETHLTPDHPGVWSACIKSRDGKWQKNYSGEVNDQVAARVIEFALPRILDQVKNPNQYIVDILYAGIDIGTDGTKYPLTQVSESFITKRYQDVYHTVTMNHTEPLAMQSEVEETRQLLGV